MKLHEKNFTVSARSRGKAVLTPKVSTDRWFAVAEESRPYLTSARSLSIFHVPQAGGWLLVDHDETDIFTVFDYSYRTFAAAKRGMEGLMPSDRDDLDFDHCHGPYEWSAEGIN